MNKYLEKLATVSSAKKALRRAIELRKTMSHDWHTAMHLGSGDDVLKAGILKPGNRSIHGEGVYLGRGQPAKTFNPSVDRPSFGVKHNPSTTTVVHGGKQYGSGTEDFAIRNENISLSGNKSYVTTPRQRSELHKQYSKYDPRYEEGVRANKLRTIPLSIFRKVFGN